MKKASLSLWLFFVSFFLMAQNTAIVNQFGSNTGVVDQKGASNAASIQQGFQGAAVSNNYSPRYSGDWIEGSYIRQIGSSNTSSVTVRSSHNSTNILQDGNSNSAMQDVGSFYERTTSFSKMGLDIDQIGNYNQASQKTLSSFGSYGVQGMNILQQGNNNIADQVSIGGMAQNQSIKQIGNNNNNPVMSLNTLDVSLTGFVNPLSGLAFRLHNGYGASVSMPISQYSNQTKGSAIINVVGDNNNTYQFQEYRVWATSGDNDALIDVTGNSNNVVQGQLGEKNFSDIDITGSNNVAATSQLGDLNRVDVDINGSGNVTGVEQSGNYNDASITQFGNSNFASVSQKN